MKKQLIWLASTGTVAFCAALYAPALAQDGGGMSLTATVGQSLRWSDNYDNVVDPAGGSTVARTDLRFNLNSETRTQKLTAEFGGMFEAGDFADRDGFETDFDQSFFSTDYSRDTGSTLLRLGADYNNSDVSDTDLELDFDDRDLVASRGELTRTDLRFGFEVGRADPVGFSFDARRRERDYSNSSNPDLYDSESYDYDAVARFDLSRTMTLRAIAGYSEYEADDFEETEREAVYAGFGLDYEIQPGLSARAQVTYDRVETLENVSPTRRRSIVHEAPSLEFGLTQELRNGTIGARYDSQVTANGRTETLWGDRTMELRNGGNLGVSLGLTSSDTSDSRAIATVSYLQEMPTGLFNLEFTQSTTTRTNDNNEALRSILSVGYDHQINSVSSFSAGMNFARTDTLNGGNDSERLDLNLTYRYAMTRDWDLNAGYEHSFSDETNKNSRRANTFFVGVERSFNFRP